MGFLDSVERGLERAVNGAFARTFRSGVQPVEIAQALKRELDVGAVIVDRDRVLAPNHFTVRVTQTDEKRLRQLGETLEAELRQIVSKYSASQNYKLLGEADVRVIADDTLTTGMLQIDAKRVEGQIDWHAVLEVQGQFHELQRGTTLIGRGSDCHIRLTDSACSRRHMEVFWDGKTGLAHDLGSTNGSKINGQRFREAALAPGTVITIGKTGLHFQLVPGRHIHGVSAADVKPGRKGAGQDFSEAAARVRPTGFGDPPVQVRRKNTVGEVAGAGMPGDTRRRAETRRGGDKPDEQPEQDFWRGL